MKRRFLKEKKNTYGHGIRNLTYPHPTQPPPTSIIGFANSVARDLPCLFFFLVFAYECVCVCVRGRFFFLIRKSHPACNRYTLRPDRPCSNCCHRGAAAAGCKWAGAAAGAGSSRPAAGARSPAAGTLAAAGSLPAGGSRPAAGSSRPG